jgi:hypothetical protein
MHNSHEGRASVRLHRAFILLGRFHYGGVARVLPISSHPFLAPPVFDFRSSGCTINKLYDPFPPMMKKVAVIVLLLMVSSTFRTPCASNVLPLKSFRAMLVLIRSSNHLLSFLNVAINIRLTVMPLSAIILLINFPLTNSFTYNAFRHQRFDSSGFLKRDYWGSSNNGVAASSLVSVSSSTIALCRYARHQVPLAPASTIKMTESNTSTPSSEHYLLERWAPMLPCGPASMALPLAPPLREVGSHAAMWPCACGRTAASPPGEAVSRVATWPYARGCTLALPSLGRGSHLAMWHHIKYSQ